MKVREPTRVQPGRATKRSTYTDEELGQEKATSRARRWYHAGFEPGPLSPIQSQELEVAGKFGRVLAAKKTPMSRVM